MIPTIRGFRWYVATMLCLATALNYLDRQTLSVLAQTIQDELKLTTRQYANITSAFLVSYTIMYAVSGRLVDRLGTRRSFLLFVTGWSVANLLHALARTALQFAGFRFLLGATESANFPAGVKAVTEWFPMRDRAMAVGIFNSGTALGAGIAAPVISWIALTFGWRWAFFFGGGMGLIWVVAWALSYRGPTAEEQRSVLEKDAAPEPPTIVPVRRLLSSRVVWGCILARVLTDPVSYFFAFWIPKYLQQERGFSLADVGKYSGLPFLALALGNLAGGAVPRSLTSRGWSLDRARKTVMFGASCLVPISCLLLMRMSSPACAVLLLSLAMFSHAAWANMTLPAEVFSPWVVGSVTGLAGALGGLMGIITQQLIGWTVQNLSFTPVFVGCSAIHLTAFVVVCLLVGRLGEVKPIPGA